jgi:tRNA-splicing ligase RtcB
VPIKAWVKGVPLEDAARKQLVNVSQLPFIFKWVAAMPDVHWGIGATVGSVIPTKGAIIPAAVERGYRLWDGGGAVGSECTRSAG